MFCRKPSEIHTNPGMYIHTKQEQDGKNEGEIQTPESVHRCGRIAGEPQTSATSTWYRYISSIEKK